MKNKVLITAPLLRFPDLIKIAEKYFSVEIYEYMPYAELKKQIYKYDGLLINARIKFDNELINKASKLRAVFSPTIGYDHVDLKSLNDSHINFSAIGLESEFRKTLWSTAEHALTLMLNVYRNIKPMNFEVENNFSWDNRKFFFNDIRNSTVGIIGFGNIGRKLCALLRPFECKILYYDPYVDLSVNNDFNVRKVSLHELLKMSDIVSLHTPLNDETKHLINHQEFSLMKPNSVIINTSRGGVINELAFISAIENKIIWGGAFDVLENESPFGVEHSALVNFAKKNQNILITPHVGGSSNDYLHKIFLYSIEKLSMMLNNQ